MPQFGHGPEIQRGSSFHAGLQYGQWTMTSPIVGGTTSAIVSHPKAPMRDIPVASGRSRHGKLDRLRGFRMPPREILHERAVVGHTVRDDPAERLPKAFGRQPTGLDPVVVAVQAALQLALVRR